ncbi:hypothetical protein [Scytonema sp. NUACC26]|uniref:hypothetical protein n=1 Tax=Scytonema sp. NUACC26 TaxID=3140176 RepID=UPI0038B2CD9C
MANRSLSLGIDTNLGGILPSISQSSVWNDDFGTGFKNSSSTFARGLMTTFP